MNIRNIILSFGLVALLGGSGNPFGDGSGQRLAATTELISNPYADVVESPTPPLLASTQERSPSPSVVIIIIG